MNKWYDKLDKDSNISVRCFVSNSNKNPLDSEKENGKLVVANIWSRSGNGKDIIYTEIRTGNHWRYAIPCEDAVAAFFDEYIADVKDINSCSYDDFLGSILCRNIDGVFHVQGLENKYNKLLKSRSEHDGMQKKDALHVYLTLWHKNHLFDCIMEECVEVMELLHLEPKNIKKIEQELNDLFAVYNMLFKAELLKPRYEKNKFAILDKKIIDKEIFVLLKNIHYFSSKSVRFLEDDVTPNGSKTNSEEIKANMSQLLQFVDKSKDYEIWSLEKMRPNQEKVSKHMDIGQANILKKYGV